MYIYTIMLTMYFIIILFTSKHLQYIVEFHLLSIVTWKVQLSMKIRSSISKWYNFI